MKQYKFETPIKIWNNNCVEQLYGKDAFQQENFRGDVSTKEIPISFQESTGFKYKMNLSKDSFFRGINKY